MADASGLSLVVVTWRSAATLPALLASVERHLGTLPEVILVENGPVGEPDAESAAYGGELRTLRPAEPLGFGAACNEGVRAASRSIAVLINPDCELTDAGLVALADVAEARSALVGPRLLNSDGSKQPSASGPPAGLWPWLGALVPGAVQPPPMQARTEAWRLERETQVAWLTGACVVAPRRLLLELGPFDPAIALFAEDMDLGLRAGARGVPSIFRPDLCRVVHVGGASTGQAFGQAETARRMAASRRAVLLRAVGPRREALAWRALRLNLALRCAAKRLVRADATADRLRLEAERAAGAVPPGPVQDGG